MSSPQFEIINTDLEDVFILQRTIYADERGLFGKIYNKEVFLNLSLPPVEWKELIYSKSKKDVIRGMHYQSHPFGTSKLISVVQGAILDVIVGIGGSDNRENFGKVFNVELSAANCKTLFVPDGYAHGFKTLEEDTIVVYLQSQIYSKKHDIGIHYHSFGFDWKASNPIVSNKDKLLPSLSSLNKQT